jgi:hypothetical protein
MPRDFSDVAFFEEKLFTLERLAHQICRRKPSNGEVERCWSFVEEGRPTPVAMACPSA